MPPIQASTNMPKAYALWATGVWRPTGNQSGWHQATRTWTNGIWTIDVRHCHRDCHLVMLGMLQPKLPAAGLPSNWSVRLVGNYSGATTIVPKRWFVWGKVCSGPFPLKSMSRNQKRTDLAWQLSCPMDIEQQLIGPVPIHASRNFTRGSALCSHSVLTLLLLSLIFGWWNLLCPNIVKINVQREGTPNLCIILFHTFVISPHIHLYVYIYMV